MEMQIAVLSKTEIMAAISKAIHEKYDRIYCPECNCEVIEPENALIGLASDSEVKAAKEKHLKFCIECCKFVKSCRKGTLWQTKKLEAEKSYSVPTEEQRDKTPASCSILGVRNDR